MQITLTSTDATGRFKGVECRLWSGRTTAGVPVIAYIAAVVQPYGKSFEAALDAGPIPPEYEAELNAMAAEILRGRAA